LVDLKGDPVIAHRGKMGKDQKAFRGITTIFRRIKAAKLLPGHKTDKIKIKRRKKSDQEEGRVSKVLGLKAF